MSSWDLLRHRTCIITGFINQASAHCSFRQRWLNVLWGVIQTKRQCLHISLLAPGESERGRWKGRESNNKQRWAKNVMIVRNEIFIKLDLFSLCIKDDDWNNKCMTVILEGSARHTFNLSPSLHVSPCAAADFMLMWLHLLPTCAAFKVLPKCYRSDVQLKRFQTLRETGSISI